MARSSLNWLKGAAKRSRTHLTDAANIRVRPFSDSRESWKELVIELTIRRSDGDYHQIQLNQLEVARLLKAFKEVAAPKDVADLAFDTIDAFDDDAFLQAISKLTSLRRKKIVHKK